jgi:hypothetical protein
MAASVGARGEPSTQIEKRMEARAGVTMFAQRLELQR